METYEDRVIRRDYVPQHVPDQEWKSLITQLLEQLGYEVRCRTEEDPSDYRGDVYRTYYLAKKEAK